MSGPGSTQGAGQGPVAGHAFGPFGPLVERGRRHRYRTNSVLFEEGGRADRVVLLLAGRVKVSSYSADGYEAVLAVRGPGDMLGELAALDEGTHLATVTAIEPLDAVVIPASEFRDYLERTPAAALDLLRRVTERLRDADRKRVEFGALDSVRRVASRLAELADRFGEPSGEGIRIGLAFTQQELAGWTGSSREAVSKALQILRRRGLIATGRKSIVVLDLDELRRRGI